MAIRNTGKPSEKIWEEAHDRLGKRAFYERLVDAAEIRGRTGRVADSARAQPSDYIRTMDGVTSYCEVKSTVNKTSFGFNLLQPAQVSAGRRVLAAGGEYWVYVHALSLGKWFKIPFDLIRSTTDKRSISWPDLAPYEWNPNGIL